MESPTDTERAVLGSVSVAEALTFFSRYAQDRLGRPIAKVRFRRWLGVCWWRPSIGLPMTGDEQRAAAGAAAWILAFNARWELALRESGRDEIGTLELVLERRDDYLTLSW